MNAFNRATGVLHDTLRKHAGVKARYTRGSHAAQFVVIPCRSDFELVDGENQSTRASTDDFTLSVSELVLDGALSQPRPGDRITIDGVVYTLMDMPPTGCWRYADQTHSEYRVFTRKA